MKILVTNDDGIHSEGMWVLVRELSKIAVVMVVAPDRERSAIGTAVSLFEPLHVEEVKTRVEGVTAYAIDGTPSDCVLLALGKLAEDSIDIVVSGINPGLNLGEDVHISGTVGAALQGYFRGYPAIAVSALGRSNPNLHTAARVAANLAGKLATTSLPNKIFLNVNVPDLPIEKISGAKITRLARASHINTVEEEDHGPHKQYRLIRERLTEAGEKGTDIRAIEQGIISITPLYTSFFDIPPQRLLKKLCADLIEELQPGEV